MKNFVHFIGIDVSKLTIDVACIFNGQLILSLQVPNNTTGINRLIKKLKLIPEFSLSTSLFCMENTGLYSLKTTMLLYEGKAEYVWIESPIQIIYSQGKLRGKSDMLDAKRIATYAEKFSTKAKFSDPVPILIKIKALMNLRTIILSTIHMFKVNKMEYEQIAGFFDLKGRASLITKGIKSLEKCILQVEILLDQAINEENKVVKNYNLIKSVPGVGKVTAIEVIIATGNFTQITDPRKFACYSGVVPFEHSSGTSINTRPKVSNQANKIVKKTLHMAAMSAIQIKGELRDYYQRRVTEGKNKMSVLNAVRNKLIHRMFACVIQDRKYLPIL